MLKHRVLFAAALALAAQMAAAQGLPDEIQARETGDAQLQSNINAEASARTSADAQLQTGINNEGAARTAADTQLQTNINNEAAARGAADAQLQTNINNEAAARIGGDARLDARIDAEAVSRMAADDELRRLIGSGGSGGGGGGGSGGGTVNVDCNTGGTIAQALAAGAARIIISGVCAGPVTINRDDVTLQGATPAATIQGPAQPTDVNTLVITGHRVTVEGLSVTGGRNGITGIGAVNLTVRNVTVHNVGRTGVVYAFTSSGTIEGCTIESNGRDGIAAEGAFVRVINSTISNNARLAILIVNGANATIGLTERQLPAGNTIQENKGGGIQVSLGSFASVAMNIIKNNIGSGVGLFHSTATIAGGNTISDNTSSGIVATSSKLVVGDTGPTIPTTVNTISGNGNANIAGGIFAGLGSSMIINNARITDNRGTGVIVSLRSTAQMSGSTIQNNTGDGIRLLLGAALLPLSPVTTVSGNRRSNAFPGVVDGFGVNCGDPESSVVNLIGPIPPIVDFATGNESGNVSPFCTQFDANSLTPPPPPPPGPVP